MKTITQDYLRAILDYNPDTGVFVRRVRTSNSTNVGDTAGTVLKSGYTVVHVAGRQHMASKLAWCYMTGELPDRNIVFIDGDKTNCAWANLRVAEAQDQVTQARLREVFDYSPETGALTYRRNRGGIRLAGDVAGWICRRNIRQGGGYRLIGFNGREYGAHRLIWVWWYGVEPRGHIDHVNMERADNRISNLRECTRSQNMMNLRKPPNNTSGHKGVAKSKTPGKWLAYLGKQHIGTFCTFEEAVAARRHVAETQYGAFARHA